MTDIRTLLERVEALTGPDRELDLALAAALVPDVIVMRQRDDDSGADPYTYWEYTASIDAALALVEKVRPGTLSNGKDPGGNISIGFDGSCTICTAPYVEFEGEGKTWPLAILSALLRSLANGER